MIDGLDGLAAGIIFLAITGLISFNLALDLSPLSNMLLAVASALLPFMVFNVAPYPRVKIFLEMEGVCLGYVIWALIYSAEKINDFTHVYLYGVAIPLFDF